jgi:hypothetical protein
MGLTVLLSLLGRSLVGNQELTGVNYTQIIDDGTAFRCLAEKFGYRVNQIGQIFQFTSPALNF